MTDDVVRRTSSVLWGIVFSQCTRGFEPATSKLFDCVLTTELYADNCLKHMNQNGYSKMTTNPTNALLLFFQSATSTRESSHFALLTLYAKHLPSYLNVNFFVSAMSGALNTMQLRPWHVFLNKLERPSPIIIPKITRLAEE